jgi:hypothetical protein
MPVCGLYSARQVTQDRYAESRKELNASGVQQTGKL